MIGAAAQKGGGVSAWHRHKTKQNDAAATSSSELGRVTTLIL
jgi:hypothetical protein